MAADERAHRASRTIEQAVIPPIERRYEHIDLLCPYGSCDWRTKHQGGFQQALALRLYREHVEAKHSGRSDREGEPCPRCCHRLSAYDWCPSCLAHVSGSEGQGS